MAIDRKAGTLRVMQVCEAFECGAILNPANLISQVQGCIIMGLGGALFEEMGLDAEAQAVRLTLALPRLSLGG